MNAMLDPSQQGVERGRDDRPGLDAAHQSLADALRVSFWVLKLAMLLLVVVYLFSGVFNVREQEIAVCLRFGRIVGSPGQQVLEPGGPGVPSMLSAPGLLGMADYRATRDLVVVENGVA